MVEVLVWLLISTGYQGSSSTVGQFKSLEACSSAANQLRFQQRTPICIQANIYIQGGKP